MKKIILSTALLLPGVSSAYEISNFEYESVQPVLDAIINWSAVFTALLTIGMVFFLATRMHGGVFNKVLNTLGVGMIFIFAAFIAGQFPQFIPFGIEQMWVNIFFILGFISIALGSSKLSQAIGS